MHFRHCCICTLRVHMCMYRDVSILEQLTDCQWTKCLCRYSSNGWLPPMPCRMLRQTFQTEGLATYAVEFTFKLQTRCLAYTHSTTMQMAENLL